MSNKTNRPVSFENDIPTELQNTAEVRALATELTRIARTRGCESLVVVSHPMLGWYVHGAPGFTALGLAHQAVRTIERFVDASAGSLDTTKGDSL